MTVLLVLVGGALGAPLRYLTDDYVRGRWGSAFPWGTLVVNVVGSFVLGAVAASVIVAGAPAWVLTLVGTGLCGALTTFSTFGVETVQLAERGAWSVALGNVVLSLALGLGACAAGWAVVTLVA